MAQLRFDERVVIVTGAGGGLGRAHALAFAARGAKVVVNDLGGSAHGSGQSTSAADRVVDEIKAAGGSAIANYDSVENGEALVKSTLDAFGRIDVLVNNAGILRDVSFHKMTDEDWDLVYRVHVRGSYKVTRALWEHMRERGYGRIVMTASAAGIYGNFGQANYAMAKLGLVGLANTLAVEGRKRGVLVNTIAPIAGSRLTETVLPKEVTDALKPEYVSPLVLWLCHETCEETGGLFEVGGGFFGKLRWERARGKTYRLGRSISAEDVKSAFGTIAGFEASEHPAAINASMAPIMENIQRGPSKGGNEFIDVDEALGYRYPEVTSSYDERDLALYALGVGAGRDPLADRELALVYEHHASFRAMPTFGVIPALNAIMGQAQKGVTAPGLHYGLDCVLHGEQYLELRRPLPPKAKLTHRARIKDIFDKGKGALVVTAIESVDESGELLAYNELTTFVRGAGGFGGERGPSSPGNEAPERAPDATIEEKVSESQALLYRLSGDWNPLHADPAFAKAFGFDRPILHGLCTFGYAARHVIAKFAPDGDPRFFKSIKVRFADSVFPGETLITEMWKEGERRIVLRCRVKERNATVISNAALELYERIPEKIVKAAPAPALTAKSGPVSSDIFGAIGIFLKGSPETIAKVQTIFQFKLSSPDSVWTLDVKSGSVAPSASADADCTLEMTDADFMDMCTGKADAQKLYFGGKLKISGNLMASQKLSFLKKVTPEMVQEAMGTRAGPPSTKPAQAAPSAPARAAIADQLFGKLAQHAELIAELGSKIQFRVTDPDARYVLDPRSKKVDRGEASDAATTITIGDVDLEALMRGESAQSLHQRGKLRVEGDMAAARKLDLLRRLS